MSLTARAREIGSAEDFEQDWAEALRSREDRWFAYPDWRRDEQIALVEWVKARQVADLLRAAGIDHGRVLEYGCGAAGISIYLKEAGFGAYVVDLSPGALEVARINDQRHRTTPGHLLPAVADVLRLPFPDRTFDVVMSFGLLEHFDEAPLRALLAEVCRTLGPGGLFVADVIPARFNARAVGNVLNLAASAAREACRGGWARLPLLRQAYFGHYHETAYGPDVYARLVTELGLDQVSVQVCRPFPPLAIGGRLEAMYARLMRRLMPTWLRFDRSDTWLTRHWGWMYLVSGRRR